AAAAKAGSDSTRRVVMPRPPADTDTVTHAATLPFQFNVGIETGAQKDQNLRCNSTQLLTRLAECYARPIPVTKFRASVKSSGSFAERFHVEFDYDRQREFDASNVLSVSYQGDSTAVIRRVELGNVSFAAPASRFITSSVPSGNYGVQALSQLGPLRFQTILAQQRGNVVQRRRFNVGRRTTQG